MTHGRLSDHPPQESPGTLRAVGLRRIVGIGGGQAIENYDWLLYGLLTAYFSPHFFPSDSAVTSTLTALSVFGVAFVARPIGAIVLGPVSDRLGRKPMMMLSVGTIAGASIIMGLLPTSESLGMLPGILLVALRLIQGLSMGIEAPLFAAYGLEVAPPGRESWYAGILQAFSQFGLLLASVSAFLSSLILGNEQMTEWGWRIPFIIGGLIGLFVLWMRKGLPETLQVEEEKGQRPTREVLKSTGKDSLTVWAIFLIVGGTQVINYGWTSGVPSAAAAVFNEDSTLIFGLTSGMTLAVLIASPIAGRIADHYGLGRTFVWSRLLSIPFTFLLLAFVWPTVGSLVIAMAAGIVLISFAMGFFNAVTSSLVPMNGRVTGVGIGQALGTAVFGGTASYLFVWLTSIGLVWLFPVYISLLLGGGVILFRAAYKRGGLHGGAVYSTAETELSTGRGDDQRPGLISQ